MEALLIFLCIFALIGLFLGFIYPLTMIILYKLSGSKKSIKEILKEI